MKTRMIHKSAFDCMEQIINVITDTNMDEMMQLRLIQEIGYTWSLYVGKIVNSPDNNLQEN